MKTDAVTRTSPSGPGHPSPPRQRATLPVLGLSSEGVPAVERALRRARGVMRAYANPATEMAYVEYDPLRTGLDAIKKAIESVGFQSRDEAPAEAASDGGDGSRPARVSKP